MADGHVRAAGGLVIVDHPWRAVVLVAEGSPPRWRLPKGLVEDGESVEFAALREVLEETGLACWIVERIGTAAWEYEHAGRSLRKEVTFFLMTAPRQTAKPLQDAVVRGRALVALNLVAELLAFDSERQIALKAIALLRNVQA